MKDERQRTMTKVLGKTSSHFIWKTIISSEASSTSHWPEQSQKATHHLTATPKGVSGDIFICAVLPPQKELGFN